MASGFPAPFDYFTRRPENILKLFKHVSCNRRDKSVESVLSKGSCIKQNNTRREQLQNLSESASSPRHLHLWNMKENFVLCWLSL